MNQKTLLLLFFILGVLHVTLCTGCKKYEETDYFKCSIDGVPWEAAHGEGLGDYPLYAYLYADTSLHIYARGAGDIFIMIHENLFVGRHELSTCGNSGNCASFDNDNSMNSYSTDSMNTGYIDIETFNVKGLRIKGKISFKGLYSDKSKTVNVSDGTFSIPLQKHY